MPAQKLQHALDQHPRVRLAHLPTPLEPMPDLSKALGNVELWVKRDDLTGLAMGGNPALFAYADDIGL